MKINGTKSYIQVEDDSGNIARFDGEVCLNGFYAVADSICWLKHQGEVTDEDRVQLIYKATQYGRDHGIKYIFLTIITKLCLKKNLSFQQKSIGQKTI